VTLHCGSVAEPPPAIGDGFDKIFTINSIHFWPDPIACLTGLHRMLKPGGLIAVTIQPRSRNATDETTRVIGQELAAKLAQAGFRECQLEIKSMLPVSAACVLGRKQ
jgi:hypothetical protein